MERKELHEKALTILEMIEKLERRIDSNKRLQGLHEAFRDARENALKRIPIDYEIMSRLENSYTNLTSKL